MKCQACGVTYSEKRPHPAGPHCPECLHPFNTVSPNHITRARHYQGCSRIDHAEGVLSRSAQAKHALRHRQSIETRQKGVPVRPKLTPLGPPTTAEYAHWSGCDVVDCNRCAGFEATIDLGYDQLSGA